MKELVSNGNPVSSGLITEKTKFIFRSSSARIVLMIQMSREMWEFADDGDLNFERAVSFHSSWTIILNWKAYVFETTF